MHDAVQFGAWEKLAAMPLPRAGCAVAALSDRIFVAGGTYWRDGKKFWCDRFDRFEPATNTWAALPALPRLAGDAAGVAHGPDFLVVGGGGSEIGSTSVLAWKADAWETWAEMPAGRRSTMCVPHDGRLIVMGGLAGGPTQFNTATQTVWAADRAGKWTECRPMPGVARFNCAVGSVGSTIFVAGGCTPVEGGVRNLDEVLAYDPRGDRWEHVGQLPMPSRGGWGLADQGRLFIFGGYTDKFERAVLAWNATTAKVEACVNLPVGLADARFVRCQQSVVGLSGEDGVQRRFGETIRLPCSQLYDKNHGG
jgi:large repetitive protein